MINKMLLDLPTCFETKHLFLRAYRAGDGFWYHSICQRNKFHLSHFEVDNPIHGVRDETDAEILVRQFAADWVARSHFFLCVFDKNTDQFVGQIYAGVVNWNLPEFEIGYFANVDHEGLGFISEAVQCTLGFVFNCLQATRVRLECDDSNLRSARVAERCGFRKEGHIRQNKCRKGNLMTGTFIYGMLREEYEAIINPS